MIASMMTCALLWAVPVVVGQMPESDGALEILRRAAAALQTVEGLSFRAEYYQLAGEEAEFAGTMQTPLAAEVKLQRDASIPLGARFLIRGRRVVETGEDFGPPFLGGFDGKRLSWLGPGESAPREIPVEEAITALGEVLELVLPQARRESPFSEELAAGNASMEGLALVATIPCRVVRIELGDARWVRWFLSVQDDLPRRMERQGSAASVLTLSNLSVVGDFKPGAFDLPLPDSKTTAGTTAPAGLEVLPVGSTAPLFELKDQAGNSVRLADMRGHPVLLDFWATWCGPCKLAMPGMQRLHASYGERGLKVLGVNCMETDPGQAVEYFRAKSFTYGLLLNGDPAAKAYRVRGIPMIYLIDREGKILLGQAGHDASGAKERELARLVEEQLSLSKD